MQVILIKDCKGPNPHFDRKLPMDRTIVRVEEDGTRVPANWPEVDKPKGMIIDHPDAHFLTYGKDPNAEPYDDEAKKKFADYLRHRQEEEERLAALDAIDSVVDPKAE